jgi:hypothetical protein
MPQDLIGLIGIFTRLISIIIPIIASLAFLSFIWGIVKFIAKAGEKEVKEGKSLMIWGVIALFVMVSAWGLVRFLSGEFGFGHTIGIPLLPQ